VALGPLVTVVTPVLNGARFLPECLESVRAQTHPAVEHIVVDGGSTDGTLELLARAPGVLWVSGPDDGMYDAVNRGFRLAHGQLLAYQNADDRYADSEALARAVAHFELHPELDVVFGDFRWIDAQGRAELRVPPRRAPRSMDELRRQNVVPPHASLVRAALVRQQGFWLDASLRYAGDWEWFVRMYLAGKRFGHLPAVLADFRVHAGAQTARVGLRRKLGEWRRICRRHGLSLTSLVWHELLWQPLVARLRQRSGADA
jgi:glycosyltransferase involved in cell wall biosynthesis